MKEEAPQTHAFHDDAENFEITNQENESPMEQKLDFNVEIVFDDLGMIIPLYNQAVESRGEKVSEDMFACQREAINTMRSIKNTEGKVPRSKKELIMELDRRTKEDELTADARELIEGIL